jgi:hypothetical protein
VPTVHCGCDVSACKATPHAGKKDCSSTADAPSWGESAGWGETEGAWDGPMDWNVRRGKDKLVPVCRECNLMMSVTESG